MYSEVKLNQTPKEKEKGAQRVIRMHHKPNDQYEFYFVRQSRRIKGTVHEYRSTVLAKPFVINFQEGKSPEEVMREYAVMFVDRKLIDFDSFKTIKGNDMIQDIKEDERNGKR